MLRHVLASSITLLALALPAQAATYTTYTSKSAFDAAAGTTTLVDFNQTPIGYYGNPGSLTVEGVTLTTNARTGLYVQDATFFGTGNMITAYSPGATSTSVDIALSATKILGFRYTSGSPTYVLVGGTRLSVPTSPFPTLGFFGFISDTPFTTLTFGDENDGLNLDELQLGPSLAQGVPEPATWALMILGFGAVGGAMRRRSRGRLALA